jgi:hypothetical protein
MTSEAPPEEKGTDSSLLGENTTLTFKSGGWALLASFLISLALLGWALSGLIFSERPIGNGSDIDSYQFETQNLDVPLSTLSASGNARDFLKTYNQPEVLLGQDMVIYNEQQRRPWLVTGDRVVGITIDGESRAYPVRCLNAHEIIQDTLAGRSIVVTYSPFADAPVVFFNQPGAEGYDFSVSGLLCNSGLVMFDRNAIIPSLWSPLFGRAISGPLAGTRLQQVDQVQLCTLKAWLEAHPDTTIVLPEPNSMNRYKEFSYFRYFNDMSDSLEFPVSPLPATSRRDAKVPRLKARVIVVTAGGVRRVWPLTLLDEALNSDTGRITVDQGGVPIEFLLTELPQSAVVQAPQGVEIIVQPRLWFAWFSTHPDSATRELVTELPAAARIEPD